MREGTDLRTIDIVIPVHNEQENVAPMGNRLMAAISPLQDKYSFRILFVDDGSTDNTVAGIEQLISQGLPVQYISLSRNFGHQAALEAGLAHSTGDAAITMDGDMQHPPEEIGNMLKAFSEGAEVVYMQRTNMGDNFKGMLGMTFYKLFNVVSDTKLVPNAADFRLLSRKVINILLSMPGHGKLLRAIIPTIGMRQITLQYTEETRKHGTASYSYGDLFALVLHAVFKFSRFPAFFTTALGILMLISGLTGVILIQTDVWPEGPHNFMLSIAVLLAGCVFFVGGILCFYLYFLLEQVRQTPRYIVGKTSKDTFQSP